MVILSINRSLFLQMRSVSIHKSVIHGCHINIGPILVVGGRLSHIDEAIRVDIGYYIIEIPFINSE